MKKKNVIIAASVLALAVVTALTACSGKIHAYNKDEAEILDVIMESEKCNDPERYLGADVENLPSASAEEEAAFIEKYNTILDQTFTDDSFKKQQCKTILDRQINSEKIDVLRSIDSGYSKKKINSVDINGDTAIVTISFDKWEKVITKQEGTDQYISGFPLCKDKEKVILKLVDNKWKVESSQLLDYVIGSEDEGQQKTFNSFEEAYAYSMSVTPDTSSAGSLK